MPNISNEQYQAYLAREAARAAAKRGKAGVGSAGVPAAQPERAKGKALDNPRPRKAKSGPRFEIVFTIRARHPLDWDNWHTKIIQDVLVHAGILDADNWRVLQGRVIAHKASTEAEEGVEIMIQSLDSFGPYGIAGDAKWSGPS